MVKAENKISLKKKNMLDQIYRDRYVYILIMPMLLWYVFMYYLPMYGITIAFKDYRPFLGIKESPWVGFKHFIDFIKNPYAVRLVRNTVLINVYSIYIHISASNYFGTVI